MDIRVDRVQDPAVGHFVDVVIALMSGGRKSVGAKEVQVVSYASRGKGQRPRPAGLLAYLAKLPLNPISVTGVFFGHIGTNMPPGSIRACS